MNLNKIAKRCVFWCWVHVVGCFESLLKCLSLEGSCFWIEEGCWSEELKENSLEEVGSVSDCVSALKCCEEGQSNLCSST